MAKKKKVHPLDLWNTLIKDTLNGTLSWKLTIKNKDGYYCVCSTEQIPKITFRWEQKGQYTLYWPNQSSVEPRLGSQLESAIQQAYPTWKLKGSASGTDGKEKAGGKKSSKPAEKYYVCKPLDPEMEQRFLQKMASKAVKWTRRTKDGDHVIYETAEHSDHKYHLRKVTKNGGLDYIFEYDDVKYRVTKEQGAAMEAAILSRGFISLDQISGEGQKSEESNIGKTSREKKSQPGVSADLEEELLAKTPNLYGRETCLMEIYTKPNDYKRLINHGEVSRAAARFLASHKEAIYRIAEHEHSWPNRYALYRRLVRGSYAFDEKEADEAEVSEDACDPKNEYMALPQKLVEPQDFVILSSINRCIHKGHQIIDVVAIIKSFTKEFQTLELEISAGYCEACKLFFIQESEYDRLKIYGRPICPIIPRKKYESSPGMYENSFAELRQYSPLSLCGYSVSSTEDLSTTARHKILAGMIDNNIMSKQGIINYLVSFINRNGRIESNKLAVAKWDEDIKFVEEYKKKNYAQVQVKRLKIKQ